jgi:hypothetical protein
MKKNLLLLNYFLLVIPLCFPQDFGFMLNQKALFSGGEQDSGANEYTGTLIPWFAAPLGNRADLYVSGGLSAQYDDKEWKPLPEIYRFEFIYNPSPDLRLEFGRVPFRESLSAVMSGLFDGVASGLNIGGGRLNAGLFYTGFLYKKTAHIYMNPQDRRDYNDEDVYFASRRLVAGLYWEKTSVFDTGSSLALGGIGQFDLNDTDARFHSQYLEAQFTLPLTAHFNTVSGAVIELVEETGKNPYAAFALLAELQWLLPTAISDVLTISGRFSSGAWNDGLGVFIPLTAEAQGKVLRPMFSGIAFVETTYTARLHHSFSTTISGAYLFRTDKTTYTTSDMDAGSASPFMGGEIYGGLSWAPFSDVLVSLGGGVFLPQTGKVFSGNAQVRYRAELAAGISL